MTTRDSGSQNLPKLLSLPGLLSVAVFGALVIVMSRLFGPENVLRDVVTELLASLGSTLLLLAIFGLLFRSSLQRLLRGAPGGEAFARSAERLSDLLQDFDQREEETGSRDDEEKLDQIESSIRTISEEELPALRNEIRELRKMLADPAPGERDQTP